VFLIIDLNLMISVYFQVATEGGSAREVQDSQIRRSK
jgi:hypothetical protein